MRWCKVRFEYQPGHSLLHRLDVRVKLLAFVVAIVLTFLFRDWVPNLLLAVLSALLLLSAGVGFRALLRLITPLTLIVVLIVGFAAFGFDPASASLEQNRRVLFAVLPDGGMPLTLGGLLYGLSLGLRILTMVILTTLLLVCTPIDHFVAAMRQARVPHPIVFIVMTALRFIPTMQHRSEQVLDAQRARGAQIDRGGMVGRIRAHIPIMVPLITSGIRMSDDLAAAMINRGYGATRRPTALLLLRASARDWIVGAATLALLGFVLYLRAQGWWDL